MLLLIKKTGNPNQYLIFLMQMMGFYLNIAASKRTIAIVSV